MQLSNLAKMAAASGDSPAHVAKLSALIQSGSYQVDAGVLSKSIIEASVRLAANPTGSATLPSH